MRCLIHDLFYSIRLTSWESLCYPPRPSRLSMSLGTPEMSWCPHSTSIRWPTSWMTQGLLMSFWKSSFLEKVSTEGCAYSSNIAFYNCVWFLFYCPNCVHVHSHVCEMDWPCEELEEGRFEGQNPVCHLWRDGSGEEFTSLRVTSQQPCLSALCLSAYLHISLHAQVSLVTPSPCPSPCPYSSLSPWPTAGPTGRYQAFLIFPGSRPGWGDSGAGGQPLLLQQYEDQHYVQLLSGSAGNHGQQQVSLP